MKQILIVYKNFNPNYKKSILEYIFCKSEIKIMICEKQIFNYEIQKIKPYFQKIIWILCKKIFIDLQKIKCWITKRKIYNNQ